MYYTAFILMLRNFRRAISMITGVLDESHENIAEVKKIDVHVSPILSNELSEAVQ